MNKAMEGWSPNLQSTSTENENWKHILLVTGLNSLSGLRALIVLSLEIVVNSTFSNFYVLV